jgi:hypothetical protein
MTSTPDGFREWDAAYVLGALSSDDRRDYERHLQGCAACAAAVAELAGLPGILSALPAAEAVAIDAAATAGPAPDDHLRTVLNQPALHQPGLVQRLAGAAVTRTRRARIRWAVGAAAAAAVIALTGGLLGAALVGTPTVSAGPVATPTPDSTAPDPAEPGSSAGPATRVVAMTPMEADALTAALTITDTDWGTRFDWSCVYLNELWKDNGPQDYDMVMTDSSGASTVLATWTATSPSTENLAASTDVDREQIRSIEIRASRSGTPLAHTDL